MVSAPVASQLLWKAKPRWEDAPGTARAVPPRSLFQGLNISDCPVPPPPELNFPLFSVSSSSGGPGRWSKVWRRYKLFAWHICHVFMLPEATRLLKPGWSPPRTAFPVSIKGLILLGAKSSHNWRMFYANSVDLAPSGKAFPRRRFGAVAPHPALWHAQPHS